MGAQGFWDDQATAARISTEHARATRKLERYERLQREYEDSKELLELGEDEVEIAQLVSQLESELGRLQEDALFTGQYDSGDALLEIHAGTGGTDAQDWAEMLLRMYQRWATDRGFDWEMIEASPGEEAGLKSTTMTVRGENAYGTLKAERGVHRLVRFSSFNAAHSRHTASS
jgi:peptide chain release factor 2